MAVKLAIERGSPVRREPFPAWPIWDEREEKALLDVLHSGCWGMLDGDKVHTFERAFAAYQGARHGTCVMSGTAGLEIGLRAVGVGAGDEVVTTPYTFIATVNAVLTVNAIPILVDITEDTFNLDPDLIGAAITPRTKAILPVHFAGGAADMDAVLSLAGKHGLRVVEDACQGWGAEWRGRRLGALGDLEPLRGFLDDVPPPRDCPVADRMCKEQAVWFTQNMLLGDEGDMDDIAEAINKIQRWASH